MRNVDLFDEYLFERLNASEKLDFEQRLKNDAEFEKEFLAHQLFVESLSYATAKSDLKKKMESIHTEAFGNANVVSIAPKHNYFKIAAVAASVSLIVFLTGSLIFKNTYFAKKSVYEELGRDVENSLIAFEAGLKVGSNKPKREILPATFEATGFAISSKGYFLTSMHVVKNADSVMIQNDELDYVSAERVWEDAKLDVAIYKIKNAADINMKDVPISFRGGDLELGEKIFALGYPRETVVYAEGNVSAVSGLNGDTAKYQLSLLINPGNSGSPVMDEQGNLVGIISGRNNGAQGVSYAVKARYIAEMIKNIPDKKLKDEILVNGHNNIKKLKRTEQIKKLKPFVYNIMVYNSHPAE
ncbi:MAG: trypsin-like peptidase domain-containing protein [Bacteroidia bacterium]|nr:trypsin-like peptidase domain-containing protein [Bacteroidia bacterium]